jgi:lycopene cyclase domain-containing protein
MSYSAIAFTSALVFATIDFFVLKHSLLKTKYFWTSYAIILPFQFLTNWWLTSRNIVMYSDEAIIGIRIASAPVEDLFFGFTLILGVLHMWEYLGRKGMQRK